VKSLILVETIKCYCPLMCGHLVKAAKCCFYILVALKWAFRYIQVQRDIKTYTLNAVSLAHTKPNKEVTRLHSPKRLLIIRTRSTRYFAHNSMPNQRGSRAYIAQRGSNTRTIPCDSAYKAQTTRSRAFSPSRLLIIYQSNTTRKKGISAQRWLA